MPSRADGSKDSQVTPESWSNLASHTAMVGAIYLRPKPDPELAPALAAAFEPDPNPHGS
jgi:hypothetical protein